MADLSSKLGSLKLGSPTADASSKSRGPVPKLWLDAWTDAVAGLHAYTGCIHCADIFADNDWRLIVADQSKKLRVWKGTQPESEQQLLDHACAVTSFHCDHNQPGSSQRLPFLAVAAGPYVFIYRNLRPFFRFVVPAEEPGDTERLIWSEIEAGTTSTSDAVAAISTLKASGQTVSARALQLLTISDADLQASYALHASQLPAVEPTYITCMTTLRLGVDDIEAPSCLVLGTESGRVMILDATGTKVHKTAWLPAPPAFMVCCGLLQVDYTIVVATRDARLWCMSAANVPQEAIELEAAACGLVAHGAMVTVGCMNASMHAYRLNQRHVSSVAFAAPILAMVALDFRTQRMSKCVCAALANGETRVYNGTTCVALHTTAAPVLGMYAGRFGREDNTLVSVLKNGTLDIKILPRTASLNPPSGQVAAPSEQDRPLDIPKKTKLYVEATQRERDGAAEMHRTFQRELCKLKLTAARAYLKVLSDGQGSVALSTGTQCRLQVAVQGLGPTFRITMQLFNNGAATLTNIIVTLVYNQQLYRVDRPQFTIPCLVPSLTYNFNVGVRCLDPGSGLAEPIRTLLSNASSSVPLLCAVVNMPVSENDEL